MALHAVQNVGPAYTAAKEFLFPVEFRRWIKLAIVAFFVSGGLNASSFQMNFGGGGSPGPGDGSGEIPIDALPPGLPGDLATIVAVLVAVAILLAIVFSVVGAVMEFVLIESLRTGDVTLRKHWSRRWRQGLRLFGFRILIAIPVLALFAGWVALFVAPIIFQSVDQLVSVSVILLGIPVLFVVGVVYAIVAWFTTVFVVPIMITEDAGVLAGWRRLWSTIRRAWKQYLGYVVVGFLLSVAVGILASIVTAIAAFIVIVPLAILAVLTHVTVSLGSTAGLVVLAALVLLFVLAMILIGAVVQVPVVTYLRYHALLVLGDVEPAFDLIPERRRSVTEGSDLSDGETNGA